MFSLPLGEIALYILLALSLTVGIVLFMAHRENRALLQRMERMPTREHWTPPTRLAEHLMRVGSQERSLAARNNYLTALDYCEQQLIANGFAVRREPFTHRGVHSRSVHPLWKFRLFPWAWGSVPGVNLLATRSANTPDSGLPPLLLVAHLDTVTRSPGADDNASGVAVLLEVGNRIAEGNRVSRDITILLVDHEEIGLLGSRAYARKHAHALHDTQPQIVVLESVGFYDDRENSQEVPCLMRMSARQQADTIAARNNRGDFLLVGYRQQSQGLAQQFAAMAETQGLTTLQFRDPRRHDQALSWLWNLWPPIGKFNRSDHKPFWDLGGEAIVVNDSVRWRGSPYHQPNDLPEHLDYERLDIVANVVLTLTQQEDPSQI